MALARDVKHLNPGCRVIVGGPHVPNRLASFFDDYPFIDIACHGEGEVALMEILEATYGGEELDSIDGVPSAPQPTAESSPPNNANASAT